MVIQLKQNLLFVAGISCIVTSSAQTSNTNNIQRPKLVVGIVVDQMRWDFLYRFYPLYQEDGGFKRMINRGFTCDNTMIPYTPTVTAAGHTCVYTGAVPATNGIVGNLWYDNIKQKVTYCCDDEAVQTVGAKDQAGKMSPRNMIVTTVGDQLRIATNFSSKVIGISIKDRAAILPAGHAANAAYWLNASNGNFITSSYYMNELPDWVKKFNDRNLTDSFFKLNWNLSLSPEVYKQYCGDDEQPYERRPFGDNQKHFPYTLNAFAGKDYGMIAVTPYGNDLLEKMVEAAVINENLGNNNATDFLTVSFSSPDYIGHTFGPDSWEQMDDFIKLDKLLGNFLSFLDARVGKENYTVFLTADHGAANSPGFEKMHNLPGGVFKQDAFQNALNQLLKINYNSDKLVIGIFEYQIVLNHRLIDSLKLNEQAITKTIIDYVQQREEMAQAFPTNNVNGSTLNLKQKQMFENGYFPNRSGDIQFVLKPGYVDGDGYGTSHGLWNPYDAHIPLLWFGWGIKQGKTNREVYMTDIAPTLSALLHIQMPSGCVGKVIDEVLK
jgi:predicted AlkP superfamily pyrophosphatase or phosphodiesterase